MCGIAGFLQVEPFWREEAKATLAAMASALAHRGPDDQGSWVDAGGRVALCHRRLSIVDLSPLGHQPMLSASGRFALTFNGEIYNHRELRRALAAHGYPFRGTSDTEVLLAAFEQWGLQETLLRSRGMFALAVWDGAEGVLQLARDRFGEKPLYYAVIDGRLLFGSELKALRVHPAWRSGVDRDALALLLRHNFIPAPHTIFQHARKLLPGSLMSVRIRGGSIVCDERSYWKPAAIAPGDEPPHVLVERVHEALQEAIRLQMVADVPVGAFLSGGIDSSLVVALMQRASTRPVRTFCIGYAERAYDESPFARRIARHLGTEHTELTVSQADARAVIPQLARIYDEPFADASQIPTYLVARLARQHVTVALSGDGGDELFGGYGRYFEAAARWHHVRRVPRFLRSAARYVLENAPSGALERILGPVVHVSARWRRATPPERVLERARLLTAGSLPELYHGLLSFWQPPDRVVLGAREPGTPANRRGDWPHGVPDLAHMMYIDTCLYLPDDILVKVDRAAMAVSLETRVPMLDAEVAAAAWRIPATVHTADGRGKWILRQLLERYVPREMFERPKQGFAVPLAAWLRGELRDWASDLLDSARLRREGFFVPAVVERRWQQHVTGQGDWASHLWSVLMFQAWLEETRADHVLQADARRREVSARVVAA